MAEFGLGGVFVFQGQHSVNSMQGWDANMRTITIFIATFVLVVVSGYAFTAEESPDKGEMQKFVGTWKGYQGRRGNVVATYKFWIEGNGLSGKSQYQNIRYHITAKGVLSEIRVSGKTIQFLVTYQGGRVPGTRARHKLELEGSKLEGTYHNIDRGTGDKPCILEKVK